MDKCYNFEIKICFNNFNNYTFPGQPDAALKLPLSGWTRDFQAAPARMNLSLTLNLLKSPFSAHSCNS